MAGHLEYFKDKNRIRYAYLNANHDRSRLLRKPDKKLILAGPNVSHSLVDIAIGIETFTSQHTKTVSYADIPVAEAGKPIEFDSIPTVIAVAESENVNMTVHSNSTDGLTLFSSEQYTGRVHWIAIDKVTSSETNVAMILEAETVAFSGNNKATITYADENGRRFQQASDTYGIEPTVLLSSTENVNLFLSDSSVTGFTINSSENFTGTVYYLAASIRIIGK